MLGFIGRRERQRGSRPVHDGGGATGGEGHGSRWGTVRDLLASVWDGIAREMGVWFGRGRARVLPELAEGVLARGGYGSSSGACA